jgi:hypothetical protein
METFSHPDEINIEYQMSHLKWPNNACTAFDNLYTVNTNHAKEDDLPDGLLRLVAIPSLYLGTL